MPSITAQTRVQRLPDALTAEINGETVTLSVSLGEYYGLNAVAADIWQRLDKPILVADLIQELSEFYDGDPALIQTDVQEFLTEFAERGMLVVEY